MATLSSYLQKWKLKLSTTKTVTAAFHLPNKEATRELKVAAEGCILPLFTEPTYIGIKLDRSLTYRRHLESLCKKLTTRVGLLRLLAGSSWGAGARSLRIANLALSTLLQSTVLSFGVEVLHAPHRQAHQRRFAHGDWMRASHTNGQPICSIRHHTE